VVAAVCPGPVKLMLASGLGFTPVTSSASFRQLERQVTRLAASGLRQRDRARNNLGFSAVRRSGVGIHARFAAEGTSTNSWICASVSGRT